MVSISAHGTSTPFIRKSPSVCGILLVKPSTTTLTRWGVLGISSCLRFTDSSSRVKYMIELYDCKCYVYQYCYINYQPLVLDL